PRINAAGRLHRADAGLELVLTRDPARAEAVADELDRVNAERRHVEERIRFEAEARVAEHGDQPAYVLAGEGWHPGVVGIAGRRTDPRPMGGGRHHVRFTPEAGGARSRAVAFGCAGRLPVDPDTAADATFTLELDDWRGTVEPRLRLRHAQPCAPAPITLAG